MTVPLRSRPGTITTPVGVPRRMGVTLAEVSVNVSATVSSEIVEGAQETGRVMETAAKGDSWVIAGLVVEYQYLQFEHPARNESDT